MSARVPSSQLTLTSYKDGEIDIQFPLNLKKGILGSAPQCDFHVFDPYIGHYHCFIVMDEDGLGGTIQDLNSVNGIYINDQKQEVISFSNGDRIGLGGIDFFVEEQFSDESQEFALTDQDKNCLVWKKDNFPRNVELPPLPDLVLIDGEYCDINFPDEGAFMLPYSPFDKHDINSKEFIDPNECSELSARPLVKKNRKLSIEFSLLSNGHVIELTHFNLPKKGTVFLTGRPGRKNWIHHPLLSKKDKIPLLEIVNGEIKILSSPKYRLSRIEKDSLKEAKGDSFLFKRNEQWSLEIGPLQQIIRVTGAPNKLKAFPFFGRDRKFQWDMGKILALILIPFLSLLLIDLTPPPELKRTEVAVVYKKKKSDKSKKQQKSSDFVDKKDMDQGIQKKDLKNKKETRMTKKAELPKKMVRKTETPHLPKKVKKISPKKMAKKPYPTKKVQKRKVSSRPAPRPKKVAKIKPYNFKLNSKLGHFFKKSSKVSFKAQSSPSSSSSSGFSTSLSQDTPAYSRSPIQQFGSNNPGNFAHSSGAKGLSSKKGIDLAKADPKVVILGSMDPELLRKILREYLPQFRHCYQRELAKNEKVKGVLDLNFMINKNGKVGKVGIKSKNSNFSQQGVHCMSRVLRLIDFPRPKGGGTVNVKQPLNFFSEKANI